MLLLLLALPKVRSDVLEYCDAFLCCSVVVVVAALFAAAVCVVRSATNVKLCFDVLGYGDADINNVDAVFAAVFTAASAQCQGAVLVAWDVMIQA